MQCHDYKLLSKNQDFTELKIKFPPRMKESRDIKVGLSRSKKIVLSEPIKAL